MLYGKLNFCGTIPILCHGSSGIFSINWVVRKNRFMEEISRFAQTRLPIKHWNGRTKTKKGKRFKKEERKAKIYNMGSKERFKTDLFLIALLAFNFRNKIDAYFLMQLLSVFCLVYHRTFLNLRETFSLLSRLDICCKNNSVMFEIFNWKMHLF